MESGIFSPDLMERLLLDVMLGKLATLLRMCGYDAAYALDREIETDDEILALAESEGRLVITRDRELAARAEKSILLESKDVDDQLRELGEEGMELILDEPSRCAACNNSLELVSASGETPEYAPDLDEQPVWRCPACGQHFWKGSHWDDVEARLTRF